MLPAPGVCCPSIPHTHCEHCFAARFVAASCCFVLFIRDQADAQQSKASLVSRSIVNPSGLTHRLTGLRLMTHVCWAGGAQARSAPAQPPTAARQRCVRSHYSCGRRGAGCAAGVLGGGSGDRARPHRGDDTNAWHGNHDLQHSIYHV